MDDMDWYRHLRAFEAQHIESVEQTREAYLADKVKAKDVPATMWADIQAHDNLLDEE